MEVNKSMKNKFIKSLLIFTAISLCVGIVGCKKGRLLPGKTKAWDECTLSSNWHGKNANMRIMNILSPNMSDQAFNDRVNWAKSRGVNYFNLFVVNKADGEYAKYSPFGPNFIANYGNIDKASTDIMTKRIKKLHKDGFGIVLWFVSDDSNDWCKKIASNPQPLINTIDSLGWFKYASIVVLGLEMDEYWNGNQVNAIYAATRTKWNGKIGTHHTSGKYTFAPYGDIVFYQVNPGTAASSIISQCKNVAAKTGKKIVAFEIERQEDRNKCQQILNSKAAYSVGNW